MWGTYLCTSPFDFSLHVFWRFIQRNKAISILQIFTNIKTMFIKKNNNNTTKNNFTFCWSSIANGSESVRPGIFKIDIVDGEWWIPNAHVNVNPSPGFRIYFNSILTPKNLLYWRILVVCRNFTNQSDWTIFIISFVICKNMLWS